MTERPTDDDLDRKQREIREAWACHCLRGDPPPGFTLLDIGRIERERFDAWLNAERALAWEDGALAAGIPTDQDTLDQNNPYRRRA